MVAHVCPWWSAYFIDNRFRRFLHRPEKILCPYVKQGMTVMDFGCGMGLFSIAMAEMVGDGGCVIAVDVQQKMLDVVEKRSEGAGVADRVRTHRCEPDSIGLDDPVDFVLAFWSIHEVPNVCSLLSETHQCLVSGGRLVAVEPKGHVSAKDFGETVAEARENGLILQEEPRIRLSRAAVFVKE